MPVVSNWGGTVVAVNVGGAVIPTLMSAHLLIKRELWLKGLVATAIVALVIHWMADPVPGLGIAVPIFMPVLVTAVVAVILSREDSAPLAYIGGSLGTLIGADLTNLDKVRGLGAPVASIGGAGTFDGIFLTGILAVLLASLYARPRAAHAGYQVQSGRSYSPGRGIAPDGPLSDLRWASAEKWPKKLGSRHSEASLRQIRCDALAISRP